MRGAPAERVGGKGIVGIIPADAGSTSDYRSDPVPAEDHPRGCGEHGMLKGLKSKTRGSSPRMRGAQGRLVSQRYQGRIIPADAGSTLSVSRYVFRQGDHPRGCGEHSRMSPGWGLPSGSSPRMRGAPPATLTHCQPGGIIPADAGSTAEFINQRPDGEDHPRGCGEHPVEVR